MRFGNTDRERRVTSITVYSNIDQPKVFLDGQEQKGIRKEFTDVHYVIDNVTLKDGENIVTTTATDKQGNKTLRRNPLAIHGRKTPLGPSGKQQCGTRRILKLKQNERYHRKHDDAQKCARL